MVSGKGKGSAALPTLIERKTRKLIIRKIKDKTQASALRAIHGIERSEDKEAFKRYVASITADNGSEFLDYEALEASAFGKSERSHPTMLIRIHHESAVLTRMPTVSYADLFQRVAISAGIDLTQVT